MIIRIVDGSSKGSNPFKGSNPCCMRATTVVEVVVASAMTMAEPGGDGYNNN